MTGQDTLVTRLAQAVRAFGEEHALTWRACHAINDLLGADGASITIDNSSVTRVTLCATDETAGLLENLQDVLEEGPCRDAFASGRSNQTLLDQEAAERWPHFAPAAEKVIGPDGVLWSIPMRAGSSVIGAISLYRLAPGPLAVPASDAQVLADAVARMLVRDPLAFEAFSRPGEGGWSARSLVQQAAGVVAGQLQISIGDALAILRSYAFTTESQLRDVARSVVNRTLDLSGS
jgi:hypothetical protein